MMGLSSDEITLGIAVLGAALGVLNTWHSFSLRKARLRVTPKWSLAQNWSGLSIEVVNLSAFPVTIAEVGFTLDHSRKSLPKRVPIPPQEIVQGEPLPTTLQPHHSLDIVFNAEWLRSLKIQKAYALTSSGKITRATSGALKQFRSTGNRLI